MDMEKIKEDYHLFIDVQIGKYFKQTGKNEFSSEGEVKTVLAKIIEVYNNLIAPEHERLHHSTTEAKTAWFNTIHVNFSNTKYNYEKSQYTVENVIVNLLSPNDMMLSFLPKDASLIMMFAGPALDAYGLPFERFQSLAAGAEITANEKRMFRWVFDLTKCVSVAYSTRGKKLKEQFMAHAVRIAQQELNPESSAEVVSKIYQIIKEQLSIMGKVSKKKNKN